jgi:endonuclease III related protein
MREKARQSKLAPAEVLKRSYNSLLDELGPQGWWPARTRLEVILGAILTQNTSWNNVRLALRRLRAEGLLQWPALSQASRLQIESCIRPAGFYRQKARTIRTFVEWLGRVHGGSLNHLLSQSAEETRRQLLELKGFGPETADAILLYAGKAPVFVADAYTRRIFSRHGLIPERATYSEAQSFIHRHLEKNEAVYNEFHALLVQTGKLFCRRHDVRCQACPLKYLLGRPPAGVRRGAAWPTGIFGNFPAPAALGA